MEDALASNGKQLGKGNHDAWGLAQPGLAEDRVSQAPAAISYSTSVVSYTYVYCQYVLEYTYVYFLSSHARVWPRHATWPVLCCGVDRARG